jgi:hypothetical protein
MTVAQKHEDKRMQDWGRRANISYASQDVKLQDKARRANWDRIYKNLCKIHTKRCAQQSDNSD